MTTEGTELSITLAGTDPDGNTARVVTRARIIEEGAPPAVAEHEAELEEAGPPAESPVPPAPEPVTEPEPVMETPAPPPEPGMPEEPSEPVMSPLTAEVQPLSQTVQIPGLSNATGHQTTETASKFVAPKVTQVVRAQTLVRRTGGFR
jgi:hypothetical protein